MASLLNDPALNLSRPDPRAAYLAHRGPRVRFRPMSSYAKRLEIPIRSTGHVYGKSYLDEQGDRRANVWIDDGLFCFSVPTAELEMQNCDKVPATG